MLRQEEIQGLAGLGELFDTLVVFENYPVDRASLAADASGLRITHASGHDSAHYPLSLMAQLQERLQLRLEYRPDLFDRESIETLGDRLVRLLEAHDCEIVAAVDNGPALLRALTEQRPDVAVVDVRLPPSFTEAFEKVADLRYGENPHQRAAFYARVGAPTHLLAGVEQIVAPSDGCAQGSVSAGLVGGIRGQQVQAMAEASQ